MPVHRKRAFPLHRVREHLETGPVVLVSSAYKGRDDIMTMGWHMVMEMQPSLLACYIWDQNTSRRLIERAKECVINVPTRDLADTVVRIGNSSGDEVPDKFAEFGLTRAKPRKVGAPLIAECYASFECRVHDARLARRYDVFILEVVAAHVAPAVKTPRTLHYRGQGQFMVAGETISRRRLFRPDYL